MKLIDWIKQTNGSKIDFIRKYDTGLEIIPDITSISFISLKRDIPEMFKENQYDEIISLISGKELTKILKLPELDRFRMIIWLEKQYKNINELEKKHLERTPDFKMVQAGIKNLDILGINNTIRCICKEYPVYTREEIRQMPYSECFEIQLEIALWNDINKKLVEINKSERNKGK